MELDDLRALPTEDQQVFLLGRILHETSRLDGVLRLLHAALRSDDEGLDMLALYDSPDKFADGTAECLRLLAGRPQLDEQTRSAIHLAITDARAVYRRRNRFVHDMLREDFLQRGTWELARMQRQPGEIEPEVEILTFDDVVNVVIELVTAVWRLRGAALHLATGKWEAYVLGTVEGTWDGNADVYR